MDEFFISVEEMPTTNKVQVSNMFNKLTAVIQAKSEQTETKLQALVEQSRAQSEQITVVQT